MIPVKQTIFYPNGNCLPACIASLLECPIEDVIQIQKYFAPHNDWGKALKDWFATKGYEFLPADEFVWWHPKLVPSPKPGEFKTIDLSATKDKYYIVTGQSPRHEGSLHCVIYQNGNMVHDPHPDNTGVLNIDSFSKIVPLKRNVLLSKLKGKYKCNFSDNDTVKPNELKKLIKKYSK